MTVVTSVLPLQPILRYMYLVMSFFLIFLPPFFLYIFFRLDRCEGCTESLLTTGEEAWSCPSCGRSTPIPSTVDSSFRIKESPYTLYQFDDQGATSTNSKGNLSSSIRYINNHDLTLSLIFSKQNGSLRPGSDAVLFMSQTLFELRLVQIIKTS